MDHKFDSFKSAASGVTEALINRLTAGVGTAWARLGSDWRPRVASLAEAEALITRLRDQYNRGVDAEALLARWRHAPSNFVVFGPRGREPEAGYIFYVLRDTAVAAMHAEGHLPRDAELDTFLFPDPQPLHGRGDAPAAFYLSFMWCRGGRRKRALVLSCFLTDLLRIHGPGSPWLYTRPTTEAALRMTHRRGFLDVDHGGPPASFRLVRSRLTLAETTVAPESIHPAVRDTLNDPPR